MIRVSKCTFRRHLITPGLISEREIYRNSHCCREGAPLLLRSSPWLLTEVTPGMKGGNPQIHGIQHNLFSIRGSGRSINRNQTGASFRGLPLCLPLTPELPPGRVDEVCLMPGAARECHGASLPVTELPPHHKAARATSIRSRGEPASTAAELEREAPESSRVQATACH